MGDRTLYRCLACGTHGTLYPDSFPADVPPQCWKCGAPRLETIQVNDLKPRAEVQRFAQLMEAELIDHDASRCGSWRDVDAMALAIAGNNDLNKLLLALIRGDRAKAREQAADTANMCMMVADTLGALDT